MTFTFSTVLDPLLSAALKIKRTPLYYLTPWLYCYILYRRTSRFQLVALQTLNSTHSAHKTKFMNPPSSPKMAIRTKEQMRYFHVITWESLSLRVAELPVSWIIGVAVPYRLIAAPTQTLPPGQQKQPLGGVEDRGKCWVGDSVTPKFLNHSG